MKGVPGKTPILVRDPLSGNVYFKYIEDLFEEQEQEEKDYQCFSLSGWANINKITRDLTDEALVKISSDIGYVKIVGDIICDFPSGGINLCNKLHTRYPLLYQNVDNGLNEDNAYMAGVMLAEKEYIRVPFDILNGSLSLAAPFVEGFCSTNLNEKLSDLCLSEIYYMTKKASNPVKFSGDLLVRNPDKIAFDFINKIELITLMYSDYIYMIHSDTGTFQAGVGQTFLNSI
jgi:hypothetical protein